MEILIKSISDLAVQIEESGIRFYHNMASEAKDQKVKKVCEFLADQEIEHVKAFRKIGEQLPVKDTIDTLTGPMENNIKSLIDIFKKSALDLEAYSKKSLTTRESIDVAIQLEEKAIKMYEKMSAILMDDVKDVIDNIIDEEKTHLQMLINVKSKAKFD